MTEIALIALVLGAIITVLIIIVISDYKRQKLRTDSVRYEDRIRELEDRIAGLELENMRLLDELKVRARIKAHDQAEKK